MKKVIISLVATALFSTLSFADSGEQRLGQLLEGIQGLQAEFLQHTFRNLDSENLVESQGQLWLSHPDRFYWQAEAPYAQVVVSDGRHLYVWDQDLEQVTREPMANRLATSPASILTAGADAIARDFSVSVFEESDSIESYALLPKQDNDFYERLVLSFRSGLPAEVQIFDLLGNATMVYLTEVEINPRLAADRFQLQVPEGTDFIYMGD